MEYGSYGDLIIIYPKPYSIYLRVTIGVGELRPIAFHAQDWGARVEKSTI